MCYCFPKQLNNLVGFLLPRIYRHFLQSSTSFPVKENPQAFVKTWFSENHQCEPGESIVFCCSTPAVEWDISFTQNNHEKRELSVHKENFFKKNHSPLEIFKSLIRVSPPIVFLYICKVSNEGIFASKSFRLSKCLLKLVFKFTWQELSKTRKNEC